MFVYLLSFYFIFIICNTILGHKLTSYVTEYTASNKILAKLYHILVTYQMLFSHKITQKMKISIMSSLVSLIYISFLFFTSSHFLDRYSSHFNFICISLYKLNVMPFIRKEKCHSMHIPFKNE